MIGALVLGLLAGAPRRRRARRPGLDDAHAVLGHQGDAAALDASGRRRSAAQVGALEHAARCTMRISNSAKLAPRQRRVPPPNGIQV